MADSAAELEAVLEYLKTTRGFDFTGYKRASLGRRIAKREEEVGVDTHAEYLDHLQVHPDEFPLLFNTILINVTAFFRDPEAWDALRTEAIPRIVAARDDDAPIRVWSAACASGEEAYTIAMLLCEELGERTFRERVKIYGTDVDEEALDEARQAVYTEKRLEAVPEDLRSRYFEPVDGDFCFRKDLRRSLIFGRNDLVQDAPISRVDLLACRNALMYFNAETQSRILRRFNFALQPEGVLFLGKSEMLLTRGELFRPIDLKRRIFSKVPQPGRPRREFEATPDTGAGAPDPVVFSSVFDATPVAQLVVDRDRTLVMVNEAARRLLGVDGADVGRPFQDLRVSYRPAELRAGLDTVFAHGRAVAAGIVQSDDSTNPRSLEVRLVPLRRDGAVTAAAVTFVDVTAVRGLERELERSKAELSAAYEELQSTIEELETTNEELQSTNEELETTNEELQSTNEELETMNEELQSSNEELETTNEELRGRGIELDEANTFMDTILTSMGVGVVVADRDQRVRVWNTQSEELWGLRAAEVLGEHIATLDVGLPIDQIRPQVREALGDGGKGGEAEVDAVDRRGRAFTCHVTIVPLHRDDHSGRAAIILTRRG